MGCLVSFFWFWLLPDFLALHDNGKESVVAVLLVSFFNVRSDRGIGMKKDKRGLDSPRAKRLHRQLGVPFKGSCLYKGPIFSAGLYFSLGPYVTYSYFINMKEKEEKEEKRKQTIFCFSVHLSLTYGFGALKFPWSMGAENAFCFISIFISLTFVLLLIEHAWLQCMQKLQMKQ